MAKGETPAHHALAHTRTPMHAHACKDNDNKLKCVVVAIRWWWIDDEDDNEGEEKVVPSLRRCFVDGDGVADLVVHGGYGARHVHALDNVHHLVRSPWHHGENARRRDNASHALNLVASGLTEFRQQSEDNIAEGNCAREQQELTSNLIILDLARVAKGPP